MSSRAANVKKTIYYLKKNGIKDTFYAVYERLQKKEPEEAFREISAKEEASQRETVWDKPVKISIVVPVYHTNRAYYKAMIESVLSQTYPFFELILADAGAEDELKQIVEQYKDSRIIYKILEENSGISKNTNAALKWVTGEYVGLLDHDDLLTKDALYEMACKIHQGKQGVEKWMLYSDEDKCDEKASRFYETHHKQEFNLDLLLSNNYICHFLVMKTELMQKLQFRCNFDGSQDYDLVLRGVSELFATPEAICHIPKVLYHWRCHNDSTAANPQSKRYAYEAGKRAVEDFLKVHQWHAFVSHLKHLGFYHVEYEPNVFTSREDVGVLGAKILGKNRKIKFGPYAGLHQNFSGYMHKASLQQDVNMMDIRGMIIREELIPLFKEVIGYEYRIDSKTGCFDYSELPKDYNYELNSQKFSQAVLQAGYRILWDPQFTIKIK